MLSAKLYNMKLIGDSSLNDVRIKSNLITSITLYQLNQKVSTYM